MGWLIHVNAEGVGGVHHESRAHTLGQTSLFNTNTKKIINKMSRFDPLPPLFYQKVICDKYYGEIWLKEQI